MCQLLHSVEHNTGKTLQENSSMAVVTTISLIRVEDDNIDRY